MSLRATCRYGERNLKIDELEKGRKYLADPAEFRLVWKGGHNKHDYRQLRKLFALTEIDGRYPSERKNLRSSLVKSVDRWDGIMDKADHGSRTSLCQLVIFMPDKGDEKFHAQLMERADFPNRSRGDCILF